MNGGAKVNIKKNRRGIKVEEATQREILRKQMELLAEASAAEPLESHVYSKEMIKIHRELSKPIRVTAFGIVLLNLFVYFLVFIKKFGR